MRDLTLNDARWQVLAILRASARTQEELNTRQLHRILADLGHPMEYGRVVGAEILGYLEAQGYVRVRRVSGPAGEERFAAVLPKGIQVLEGHRTDPGIGVWAQEASG